MTPLLPAEVRANEEHAGRFKHLGPLPPPGPARDTQLAAQRAANNPCPVCRQTKRNARLYVNHTYTDAQAYCVCQNCAHCEMI